MLEYVEGEFAQGCDQSPAEVVGSRGGAQTGSMPVLDLLARPGSDLLTYNSG